MKYAYKNKTCQDFDVLMGINGHEPESDVYKQAAERASDKITVKDYGIYKNVKNGKCAVLNDMVN